MIPEQFYTRDNGEKLLLYDSGNADTERLLIFGSSQTSELLLSEGAVLMADGTFSVVPHLFDQLYSIHVFQNGFVIPCVLALTSNRRQESYVRIIDVLKQMHPKINPRMIITDFEKSAINAFSSAFPRSSQHGCFFHFSQTMWRQVIKCLYYIYY